MNEQPSKKNDALLQLSLRQEDMDNQVLQALQQAFSAIVQAQQLLQQDVAFHRQLCLNGDGNRPVDFPLFQGVGNKSGLPGNMPQTTPELQ